VASENENYHSIGPCPWQTFPIIHLLAYNGVPHSDYQEIFAAASTELERPVASEIGKGRKGDILVLRKSRMSPFPFPFPFASARASTGSWARFVKCRISIPHRPNH
jgi:hypothetical protein